MTSIRAYQRVILPSFSFMDHSILFDFNSLLLLNYLSFYLHLHLFVSSFHSQFCFDLFFVSQVANTSFVEYQIVFSASSQNTYSLLTGSTAAGAYVYVTPLLGYNNYPCFYDSLNPRGYSGSGRWVVGLCLCCTVCGLACCV